MEWFETRRYPADAKLLPPEELLVADASDKRRREFVAGRHCARGALAQLAIGPTPILAGSRGEPLWPDGVVGSITHCAGYTAAAVAWADDVPALGIDAEPNDPLPAGIFDVIVTPAERLVLAERPSDVCWDRLLFSAKESVFKAWYPLHERMLEFEDVVVDLQLDGRFGTSLRGFAGRWTVDGRFGTSLRGFAGRWTVDAGIILTAVTFRRS